MNLILLCLNSSVDFALKEVLGLNKAMQTTRNERLERYCIKNGSFDRLNLYMPYDDFEEKYLKKIR